MIIVDSANVPPKAQSPKGTPGKAALPHHHHIRVCAYTFCRVWCAQSSLNHGGNSMQRNVSILLFSAFREGCGAPVTEKRRPPRNDTLISLPWFGLSVCRYIRWGRCVCTTQPNLLHWHGTRVPRWTENPDFRENTTR